MAIFVVVVNIQFFFLLWGLVSQKNFVSTSTNHLSFPMFHKFLSSGLYSNFRQIPKGQNFRVCVNLCLAFRFYQIFSNFLEISCNTISHIVVWKSFEDLPLNNYIYIPKIKSMLLYYWITKIDNMGSNLFILLGLADMSEFENRDSSLWYEFYVSKAFNTPCFKKHRYRNTDYSRI